MNDDVSARGNSIPESPDNVFAARLRGFGPLGLLAIVLIFLGNGLFLPGSALLVLLWVHLSQTPWREIGFVRPKSWLRVVALGILFGVTFKFLMKSVVMPLLGADPINHAYHYLTGNRAAIPITLYLMIVGAGVGEETMFRGFMFERLHKLFGTSVAVTGRIFLLMIAHAAFDLTAYAMIYWDLETRVAHLLFK